MGSPETEPERYEHESPHVVNLTRGFFCGIAPVTQAQWVAVMGENPSRFEGDGKPVDSVSWEDATAFCATAAEMTGCAVRLPTEAEWEYACRAGTTTPFYWGEYLNGTHANCDGRSPYGTSRTGPFFGWTSAVGLYAAEAPHPWGLTDCHGNVWEWCADWYDEGFYSRSPGADPECQSGKQMYRLLRGGSWGSNPDLCRAAYRLWFGPGTRNNFYFGFRVVFCLD